MKHLVVVSTVLIVILFTIGCQTVNKVSEPTQKWYDGELIYEIYPRAFSQEGSLKAVENRLDELNEYGIKTIWLMPVHPIGIKGRKMDLGSPYSIKDYYKVNPEIGTKKDLKDLVNKAHSLGMKVLLDIAMNHCANDHVLMEEHPDWYAQDEDGNFTREVADWSDVTDWNFDVPEVHEYLTNVLLYNVREYDIDGYRCDVAGMAPYDFWKNAIYKLKKLKPDVFMLAEWQDQKIKKESGFDCDYDWRLYHAMVKHLNNEIALDSLRKEIELSLKNNPSLHLIENHDEKNSQEVFGESYKPYASLIFTIPGNVMVYNGQEVGNTHRPDHHTKEEIIWDAPDREKVFEHYSKLIYMRNEHPPLKYGKVTFIDNNCDDSVLSFINTWQDDQTLTLINFSNIKKEVTIPTGLLSEEILKECSESGEAVEEVTLAVKPYGFKMVFD